MLIRLSSFGNVIVLFFMLTLGTSCSHKYYAPNDGDLVMLRKQNDVHVSGAGGTGTNFQVGYSPIKHLGLAASYFELERLDSRDGILSKGDGHLWNGSVGGYYFFSSTLRENPKKTKKKRKRLIKNQDGFFEEGWLTDIYIGHGRGVVNNYYKEGGSTHFQFQKTYVQFGWHFMAKSFGFSHAVRVGTLNYGKGQIYGTAVADNTSSFNVLTEQNKFNLIESSIRIHFGFKHIRWILSMSAVKKNVKLNELGVINSIVTMGMMVELDEFFRKKTKPKKEKKVEF